MNKLIRSKDPTIPTFASWHDIGYTMFLFVTGLLPFLSVPYDAVSAPYLTRDLAQMRQTEYNETGSQFALFQKHFLAVMKPWQKVLNRHLLRRGIFHNYWVLNDIDEFEEVMTSQPTSGYMTDRPAVMY